MLMDHGGSCDGEIDDGINQMNHFVEILDLQ